MTVIGDHLNKKNRRPYRSRISEGRRILLLRRQGSFPLIAGSSSSGCWVFSGSWIEVNWSSEPLSSGADISISGEVPGQLPRGPIAMISSLQWELEAPAMHLPNMQTKIVSALFDGHHVRGILVGNFGRDLQKEVLGSRDR